MDGRMRAFLRSIAVGAAALLVTVNGAAADTGPTRCDRPLARRLYEAALAAPQAARDDGSLYGMPRWSKATGQSYLGLRFPGLLSCAYTVSAILHAACYPIGRIATVKGVDAKLSGWPRVTDPHAVRSGDVVFWRPTGGRILGWRCPGHWHVGISVGGDATVDNDWWSGKPKRNTLERSCTTFAYARRPPG
jgi:hypothetical protein